MRPSVAIATTVVVLSAACSGCSSASTPVTPSASRGTVTSAAPATAKSASIVPPAVNGLAWHPAGRVVAGQAITYVATTRHGSVALLWMNPALLSFRYIPGSGWPEHSPILPADRQPSTWAPRLAAAFNGAFKLSNNDGGYYYAGRVVSPLRVGLAALIITRAGRLSVVKWGREQSTTVGLSVVRENLPLLVDNYVARTSPRDTTSTWGWADYNTPLANRSALGELANGSLVYAYGHSVTAADMSAALVLVHARTAIMLDMNLSQPGGFVYWKQGGHIDGERILPSIYHIPAVYLHQYRKDFVAALIAP